MLVPPKTWQAVFRRDRGYCRYCGEDLLRSLALYLSATVDHLVPRSRGGKHDEANLVCCCTGCNGLLSRCTLTTFEERRVYLEQRRPKLQGDLAGWAKERERPTGAAAPLIMSGQPS